MNRSIKTNLQATVLCAAFISSQALVLADEVRSSAVETSTPAGTASSRVTSATNGAGTATEVHKSVSTPGASHSSTYKAEAGPDGAKVSKTHTNASVNPDGSVSTSRAHESHKMSDMGDSHHVSNSATTVGPDGSTATVKNEARTTTP